MKSQLTNRQRAILREIVRESRKNAAHSAGWTPADVTVNGRAASAREVWSIIRKVGESRFETRVDSGIDHVPSGAFGSTRMGYRQRQWSSLSVRPVGRSLTA